MHISEPLALAHANETSASAHVNSTAQLRQQSVVPGTPAFIAWAHHDSVTGHAANALQLLLLLEPDSFADPDTRDSLERIARRLFAIVELER